MLVYVSMRFRSEFTHLNHKISRRCLLRVRTHTPPQILFVYSIGEALTGASRFWHFEKQYFISSQINNAQNSLCFPKIFYPLASSAFLKNLKILSVHLLQIFNFWFLFFIKSAISILLQNLKKARIYVNFFSFWIVLLQPSNQPTIFTSSLNTRSHSNTICLLDRRGSYRCVEILTFREAVFRAQSRNNKQISLCSS